jgi:arylsulfatase A-like enzyme
VLYQTNPWVSANFGFHQGFRQYHFGHYHEQQMTAEPLVDAFLQDLRITPGRQFFAFIQFMDPHLPYAPPERWVDEFATDYSGPLDRISFGAEFEELEDLKEWMQGFSEEDLRHIVSLYDGSIRYVDEQIGRLLGELDDRGLMDDTWVVVLSDHGEEFSLRGRDLFAAHVAQDASQRVAFSEITLYGNEQKAAQTGHFKLIWDTKTGRTELYDMIADPLERQALDLPEVERSLGRTLAELALENRGPRGSVERVDLDPETIERLQALGYLR